MPNLSFQDLSGNEVSPHKKKLRTNETQLIDSEMDPANGNQLENNQEVNALTPTISAGLLSYARHLQLIEEQMDALLEGVIEYLEEQKARVASEFSRRQSPG
eukprot:jgi/Botrbrau1/8125/Bobra.0308s0018.2